MTRNNMKRPLSLYLHIPFCKQKCKYCDFLSQAANSRQRERYVQAFLMELESYRGSELSQRQIHSIFIGGGTPTILEIEQLERIISKVKSIFNKMEKDSEITIELNPGTVTKESCLALKSLGINRVSVGLQSTNDSELAYLGRIHDFQAFLDTYQWLRDANFARINVDLMSALPGQTIESYEQTLRTVLALKPEHISAYSLIIEEGTPFFELYGERKEEACCLPNMQTSQKGRTEILPLPGEEEERRMYQLTKEVLLSYGYERYEISNYAKPGEECRHNLVYWRRGEYLGLGLGSSSFLGEKRIRNEDNLERYLSFWENDQVKICSLEEETLTKEDAMSEFMYLGLRLTKGVCLEEFKEQFGAGMMDVFGDVIRKYEAMKLLKRTSTGEAKGTTWLSLTEEGISVSNQIFVDFLL